MVLRTKSLDTTTPSSTSNQPAVELIIPETQEGAGLEMDVGQADEGLLLEGTPGMTVMI